MLVGNFKKEPGDKSSIVLDLHRSIFGVDYIVDSQITASLKTDPTSDQTSTVINKSGSPPTADLVGGTATGGSTTELICATAGFDFKALGVKEGFALVNVTKKWRVKITLIKTTALPNDTLVFEAPASAAALGDVFQVLMAKIPVKAGTDEIFYRLTYLLTTNLGQVLEDTVYMEIDDK